jgi:hypothetical protein
MVCPGFVSESYGQILIFNSHFPVTTYGQDVISSALCPVTENSSKWSSILCAFFHLKTEAESAFETKYYIESWVTGKVQRKKIT